MSGPQKSLVICLGNPDRGDDGVGPAVARALAGRLTQADVIVRSGDMLALLDEWSERDFVVLVDAAAAGSQPGRIRRLDLADGSLPRDPLLSSTHAFGLADAFDLACTLGMRPRRIVVYAVEGSSFVPGSGLSPPVADAIGRVSERVAAEIASHCPQGGRAHA